MMSFCISISSRATFTSKLPLEDIVTVVQPILSEHGFSVSFSTQQNGIESVKIVCTLMHKDGHTATTELELPTEAATKGMNKMQAIGAAITYGKRYTLCSILNITTTADDCNNGFAVNAKTSKPTIDDDRLTKAIESINNKSTTLDKVKNAFSLTDDQLIRIGKEVTA